MSKRERHLEAHLHLRLRKCRCPVRTEHSAITCPTAIQPIR